MSSNTIDSRMAAKMFLAGAKNLEQKKELINELNVFPVPDGDTGTNMTMTIMSAAKEVSRLEEPDMEKLSKAISSGSLRGARGNSGVILSQLFRGFTREMKEHTQMDTSSLARGMERAVETAYKAVMKPKEGTILTVAKGVAEKAAELVEEGREDIADFLGEVIGHAEYVLSQTPEMLPVLKQAGVVDSGGQGLVEVLKGCYDAFMGKEIELDMSAYGSTAPALPGRTGAVMAGQEVDIRFGYCTEFIIMLNRVFNIKKEMDFKQYLESIGDSIVVVADDDVVKVHVHTNDPGLAIQRALKYGALSNMKIDNMRLEHQETLFRQEEQAKETLAGNASDMSVTAAVALTPDTAISEKTDSPAFSEAAASEKKECGFIAVSAGEGLNEIFRGLGVDHIIEGGQTMNPSTEDILNAVKAVPADTVFVLPNNKNIILAANQAQILAESKKVVVIPTKTVPQGIAAVINFVPELSAEENETAMLEEIKRVRTGQITYAVRDTMIEDKSIHQGDYMGLGDDGILSVGTDMEDVTLSMVRELVTEDTELLSIYYGQEVSEEAANALKKDLEKAYPSCDIELQYGGQPIYYYIISAE